MVQRRVWIPVLMTSLAAVVYLLHQDYGAVEMNLYLQIFIYSAAIFACCMACHGELVRLKPSAEYLTSFYLMIAVGGALGGVFVNLVAPFLFKGYWEFSRWTGCHRRSPGTLFVPEDGNAPITTRAVVRKNSLDRGNWRACGLPGFAYSRAAKEQYPDQAKFLWCPASE